MLKVEACTSSSSRNFLSKVGESDRRCSRTPACGRRTALYINVRFSQDTPTQKAYLRSNLRSVLTVSIRRGDWKCFPMLHTFKSSQDMFCSQ